MFNELVNNLTNTDVFIDSLKEWFQNISVNSVIIFVMMIFMIVGVCKAEAHSRLSYN